MPAPSLASPLDRLNVLRRAGLLDSPPDETFDRVTRMAAGLLGAPVALLTLCNGERQVVKSWFGPGHDLSRHVAIADALGRHVARGGEPLVVEDARHHPLTGSDPDAREAGVVACLGAPLVVPGGQALGMLCVVDAVPRQWTGRDQASLRDLAAIAMTEITLRTERLDADRMRLALEGERDRMGALFEQSPAFIAWGRGPTHVFEGVNRAYYQLVGFRDIIGKPVAEALPEMVGQGIVEALDRVLATGEPFVAEGMQLFVQRTPDAEPEERFLNFVYQPVVEPDGTRSGIFCHGVDVTAQVRATMAARESEERHRDLLDTLPLIVYRAESAPPYRALFVNRAVEMLGYSHAEWLARDDTWQSLLHPDDRERVLRAGEESFRSGAPASIEYRIVARNGDVHWIQDRGQFVPADGGARQVWQGIMLDITAQRAAEEALRRSDERFRLAGQATREVIWDWDVRSQTLSWSDAVGTTFGYPLAQVTPHIGWWYDRIHPDDLARVRASIEGVLAGTGLAWSQEYRFRRGDGSYAQVLDRGIVARDDAGAAVRMVGSMMDLTDGLEAASAIRFQAHLLDTVEQGIIATSASGQITYLNAFAQRLYGFTSAELVGRSIIDLAVPADAPLFAERFREVVQHVTSWTGQLQRRRRDGSVFTAHVTASPICDADGRVVGVVSLSADATERLFLEEQLRQSQKMEAVGRLAGGIAHDFNNLLTVIKASSGFLLEELDAPDPRRDDVLLIAEASERAAALTRQLLAFSRRQILDPSVLNLNVAVQNLLPMLDRLIGEDVAVVTLLGEGLGSIMADVGQIEQVLVNLAVNARDAMPDGGRIVIETRDVTLDDRYAAGYAEAHRSVVLPGEYVMLAVSDTGTGMTPAVRARVFEPFYTTKETGKGTGLGLSTVYGIVKQSGGHVWVYSELGEGSVFKVYFPRLAAPAASSLVQAAAERPTRGSETILLAEDEDQLRLLARRVLERHGYTVLESRNGREALARATQYEGQIHLVLTDVVMPEMSGRGLVERLRAVRPQAAVIYMSGYTDDDVLRRGMVEAGSRFVQKPFSPAELLRLVREALDERA